MKDIRDALSRISLAEADSTTSAPEKVRDMARTARVALEWMAHPPAAGASSEQIHLAWRGALKACGVSDADRDAIADVVRSMLATPTAPAVAAEPNCNHEWRPAAIYGGRRIEWCAHCDALRWVVLEYPAVAAEPSDAATLAIKALEAAKNGLEWYRDARPMLTDGSDDEMDEQIDAAILALRQGTAAPASVPAVSEPMAWYEIFKDGVRGMLQWGTPDAAHIAALAKDGSTIGYLADPKASALEKDAARWKEIERRFILTKTSQAERICADLSLSDDFDACEDTLESLIDAAIAGESGK